MTPTLCYLAEPIDQIRDGHPPHTYTKRVADDLDAALGAFYSVYRPRTAWNYCADLDPRVDQINRRALHQADLLVALLPHGVPTVGVPMEIEHAANLGIPTIVVTGNPGQALTALATHDHVRLVRLAGTQMHDSVIAHAAELLLAGHRNRSEAQRTIRLQLADDTQLPTRAFQDDAGIDLTVMPNPDTLGPTTSEAQRLLSGAWTIRPGQFLDIPSQVQGIQLPPDTWAMITGRSSTLRKHGLHIPIAIIDPGWRGPLYTGVWNLGDRMQTVRPGTRLAQLIVMPNLTALHVLAQVDKVDDHDRGHRGFGSSG